MLEIPVRLLFLLLVACPQPPEPVPPAPPPEVTPQVVRKPAGNRHRAPKAKPCLAPPTGDGLGEEGITGSQGLNFKQIRDAVRGFDGPIVQCAQIDVEATGRMLTEITVGCDGLVKEVLVLEDGGLPQTKVDCMREALYYAPFPAHDLPDGATFQYPFEFSKLE